MSAKPSEARPVNCIDLNKPPANNTATMIAFGVDAEKRLHANACSLFSASTPKAIIVAVLFAGGLFRSMQFTGLASLGFADIHQSQMSGTSTLSSMVQQMTFGMGIAFGAIALRLAGLFHPANTTESLTVGDFR